MHNLPDFVYLLHTDKFELTRMNKDRDYRDYPLLDQYG